MIKAAFTLLLFLVSGLTATAQIPLGPEFRVDTTIHSNWGYLHTTTRAVSMAPDGRFVVVWQRWNFETPEASDVVVRRFNAAGVPTGTESIVNSYTTGYQDDESVAMDDAGNFVVTWNSFPGDSVDVMGQRFDATGGRIGANFLVNETTSGRKPSVAIAPAGEFAVVWQNGDFSSAWEVRARRYDASGAPTGGEFQVNTPTTNGLAYPSIDFDVAGNFVVVWSAISGYQAREIRGRLFTAAGAPQGPEFVVSAATYAAHRPRVARAPDGSFVVAWRRSGDVLARQFDPAGAPIGAEFSVTNGGGTGVVDVAVDADGDFVIVWGDWQIRGRRYDAAGVAGPEFMVNSYATTGGVLASVANDSAGNFVVTWHNPGSNQPKVYVRRFAGGLTGTAMSVDASAGPTSDGNGVLEAGETVAVAPSWLNADFDAQTFSGTTSSFTGPGTPGDPAYAIADGAATYGTVASGATGNCAGTADCYALGITVPGTRPAPHWDASFREEISPANLWAANDWTLHVGDSFSDVPRSSSFYPFVETLLHHGVTGGCSATTFCPASPTTREQMAVFVLVAKESGYTPLACTTPMFNDVPASSPFCPWIEELARRGVVAGCGGGNYCPTASATRDQMAVFVLRTLDPALNPPACVAGSEAFSDVPASNGFCRWIEELARRGVVTGCGGGAYCPIAPVTREQMGVFLSGTFGLVLYGP